MPIGALVDTGAIVALLDKNDPWHAACAKAFTQIPLPLLTSEAVLTELFYFMEYRSRNLETAFKFVRSGIITVGSIVDDDLPGITRLMRQYHDRPMDFADATLVHLAEREQLNTVVTIDFSDFLTYRIAGRRPFRILPSPATRR
jgi:predicted nucleic acid-binding protein